MRAPFPYFGGKSRAAELVWSRLGDVGNYVEPFAGSLAVLLARPHEPRVETVNDADCYISNFWRALSADPLKVAKYADWPVSECDLRARHKWLCQRKVFRERMLSEPHYYDAKVAGWWVWGISQWIGAGWCSRPEWIGRGHGGGRAPRGLNASVHISSSMGVFGHLDGKYKRPVLNRGARGVVALGERRIRSMENPDQDKRPHLSDGGNGLHAPGVGYGKLPRMDRSYGIAEKRPNLSGHAATGVASLRPIVEWMLALAERLRRVRVCCGDWSRIVTPSCTWKLGGGQLTGVFLDPPYSLSVRDNRLYSVEHDIAGEVRAWAIDNGGNPRLRIALCGLEGEHDMPPDWERAHWKAPRGYSNKGPRREVIWFSPHCLKQGGLFDGQ